MAQRLGVLAGIALIAAVVAWMLVGDDADDNDPGRNDASPDVIAQDSAPVIVPIASTTAAPAPAPGVGPLGTLPAGQEPLALSQTQGLSDGDSVTVNASIFLADEPLGVLMCVLDGGGVGVENCDIGTVFLTNADKSGGLSATFAVVRFIVIGEDVIDCAVRTCSVVAGSVNDNGRAASAPVSFVFDQAEANIPEVTIDPADGLVDGQPITVRGSGFPPNDNSLVIQCVLGGGDNSSCISASNSMPVDIAADGTFTLEWFATGQLSSGGEAVDCAAPPEGASCVILATVQSGNPLGGDGRTRFAPAVALVYEQ